MHSDQGTITCLRGDVYSRVTGAYWVVDGHVPGTWQALGGQLAGSYRVFDGSQIVDFRCTGCYFQPWSRVPEA